MKNLKILKNSWVAEEFLKFLLLLIVFCCNTCDKDAEWELSADVTQLTLITGSQMKGYALTWDGERVRRTMDKEDEKGGSACG